MVRIRKTGCTQNLRQSVVAIHELPLRQTLVFLVFFLLAFLTAPGAKAAAQKPAPLKGTASWYSHKSPGIKKYTASGERFDDSKHTCASWHFKFGTKVKVTNLRNGKYTVCRINDRGPSKKLRRLIDLTPPVFRQISDLRQGLIRVSVTPL